MKLFNTLCPKVKNEFSDFLKNFSLYDHHRYLELGTIPVDHCLVTSQDSFLNSIKIVLI